MNYGAKRDYRKIHVYAITAGGQWVYVATTTWAKNLRVARERVAEKQGKCARGYAAEYAD